MLRKNKRYQCKKKKKKYKITNAKVLSIDKDAWHVEYRFFKNSSPISKCDEYDDYKMVFFDSSSILWNTVYLLCYIWSCTKYFANANTETIIKNNIYLHKLHTYVYRNIHVHLYKEMHSRLDERIDMRIFL